MSTKADVPDDTTRLETLRAYLADGHILTNPEGRWLVSLIDALASRGSSPETERRSAEELKRNGLDSEPFPMPASPVSPLLAELAEAAEAVLVLHRPIKVMRYGALAYNNPFYGVEIERLDRLTRAALGSSQEDGQ